MSTDWFKKGLRFKCTGCGKCCTGADGYVFLTSDDIRAMASHLHISEKEFVEHYTRIVDGNLCLIDFSGSDHCIFLVNHRCSIYPARPTQCKTYPWWIHNIDTAESWNHTATFCEGINHPQAPLISADEIGMNCLQYLQLLHESIDSTTQ
jgi:Fe-S-cluster containining protein